MEQTPIDDRCTALLTAAQDLAEAALRAATRDLVERVAAAWDTGGHLQVSVELPARRLTVMLVETGRSTLLFHTAADPNSAPPVRRPAERLN